MRAGTVSVPFYLVLYAIWIEFTYTAGKTVPMEGQSDENLSMDVLVDDLVALVQTIFKDVETAPVLMVIGF